MALSVVILIGVLTGGALEGSIASVVACHPDHRPHRVLATGDVPRELDGTELIRIGDLHEVQNHFQEALPYYERAVSVYRKHRNRHGEATALARIGGVLKRQQRYEDALQFLLQADGLWSGPAQRLPRARTLLDIGQVAQHLGRLEVARRAYGDATTLFNQIKNIDGALESNVRLGSVLSAERKTQDAVTLLQRTIADAQASQRPMHQLRALIALAEVKAADDPMAAMALYEQALELAIGQQARDYEASVRSMLPQLLERAGRHEAALDMASRALTMYQSLRDRSGEAQALVLLGTLHRSSEQWGSAIEYYERALNLYRALRDRPREAATLLSLSSLYAAQGARDTAQEAHDKAQLLLSPSP